jgi:hypothetical protein
MDLAQMPGGPLLAALVVGHVVADFVLQTRRMVEAKRTARGLLQHAALVAASHAAGLALVAWAGVGVPLVPGAAAVAVLTAAHAAVDAWKVRRIGATGADGVRLFLADQALHATSLLAVWAALAAPWSAPAWRPGATEATRACVLVAVYALNVTAAGAAIGMTLKRLGFDAAPGRPSMGRAIGVLERVLLVTLVLLSQWGAVGFVLTAKSVARFPNLKTDEQHFAEYFLLGTLMSASFAIGSGIAARLLLGT